jgi:hypothetical protein
MLLNKNCIVRERAEIIYLRRAGETLDFIEETNEAAELFASLGVQLADTIRIRKCHRAAFDHYLLMSDCRTQMNHARIVELKFQGRLNLKVFNVYHNLTRLVFVVCV